jgi:toxin ParE1/3/4
MKGSMHKVIIRPRAKWDLKKIWRYTYKNWGVSQADTYAAILEQAIITIPENPQIGMSINTFRKDYRQYPVKHHLIIYRLTNTHVEIIRVLGETMKVLSHI